MGRDEFEELLTAMPDIAEAVNRFTHEAVQREVLAALLSSWGTQPRAAASAVEPSQSNSSIARKSPRVSKKPRSLTMIRDLNLRPDGLPSVRQFAESKKPTNMWEQVLVAVYYLERTLGLPSVSVDHVFTAFREMEWRVPADLANKIAQTASTRGWLDTSNYDAIQVTVAGSNRVEFDMPEKGP